MKKTYLILPLLLTYAASLFAQTSTETTQEYTKGVSGTAVVITCEGQPKNVEEVMKKKFKESKGKGGSDKGWTSSEGAIWTEVSDKTLDYFFKVEDAGDNKSKIMIMMSFGNANFLSSKDDAAAINNCKKMLDGMVNEIRLYELGLAIAAQTKVVEGAQKELEKLVKEGEDLVAEQKNLEKEIAENKTGQEENKKTQVTQTTEIETQKKLLQELQAKMK